MINSKALRVHELPAWMRRDLGLEGSARLRLGQLLKPSEPQEPENIKLIKDLEQIARLLHLEQREHLTRYGDVLPWLRNALDFRDPAHSFTKWNNPAQLPVPHLLADPKSVSTAFGKHQRGGLEGVKPVRLLLNAWKAYSDGYLLLLNAAMPWNPGAVRRYTELFGPSGKVLKDAGFPPIRGAFSSKDFPRVKDGFPSGLLVTMAVGHFFRLTREDPAVSDDTIKNAATIIQQLFPPEGMPIETGEPFQRLFRDPLRGGGMAVWTVGESTENPGQT